MTIDADLATLRSYSGVCAEFTAALVRVGAEISRLERHPDAWSQQAFDQQKARAEAAEAKNAKLSALVVEQETLYRKERRAAEAEVARLRSERDLADARATDYELQAARLRDGLRPFAEKWDLHAADYLAELVDGEEARVLPARVVAEMIEDIRHARALLAEDT